MPASTPKGVGWQIAANRTFAGQVGFFGLSLVFARDFLEKVARKAMCCATSLRVTFSRKWRDDARYEPIFGRKIERALFGTFAFFCAEKGLF